MPKNNKILLPPDFFAQLHNKHLLLDTSFFGDYSSYPETFLDFINQCKENNVTLVTIVPVVAEFTRGSDNMDIFINKTQLIERIVDKYLLPIHPDVFTKEIPWLVEKYGQDGKAVSLTDFSLAAMIKIHKTDLYLLTKNPKDFPTYIFTLKSHFLLELERGLQVYGVYCYEEIIKTDKTKTPNKDDLPF